MGLPDQAKAKPVSSLRAFFEQQGNASVSTDQKDNQAPSGGNGSTPKTRVRSNFIHVGKPSENTQSSLEPAGQEKLSDPVNLKKEDESPKKENVRPHEKKEMSVIKEESEKPEVKPVEYPVLPKANGSGGPPTAKAPNGSSKSDKIKLSVEPLEVQNVAESPVPAVNQSKPASTPKLPRTPTTPAAPQKTPPPKAATPSSRVVSTPKRPPGLARTPKSPPTPKQTPPSVKDSPPIHKKAIGPLSPTKSSTSRSSSPFLSSPTGFTRTTPKKEPASAKVSRKDTPSTDRKVSTPKSLAAPVKSTPKTTQATPKPVVKVSPAPKQVGVTPKTKTPTPGAPSVRPRSAQSEIATPSPSRRIVSHPPRPATAASNKPSPKLTRASSMQHLPRKRLQSEQPPVPPLPHGVPPSSTSEQDYSHLPAFMRPTQASSAKVVARPTSAMERRAHSGNFKV